MHMQKYKTVHSERHQALQVLYCIVLYCINKHDFQIYDHAGVDSVVRY